MAQPQDGILPEPSANALFMLLRVRDPAANATGVAGCLSKLPALTRSVTRLDPKARLTAVASLGSDFWDAVSPGRRPRGLRPFAALEDGGRSAPATGGDLLLHLLSRRRDLCFELATRFRSELGDRVEVMEEVHGFRYLDARDLTGFIDGTENPRGAKKRASWALVGDEDPAFAGGSYVFTQRYVHDLETWKKLPVKEQERVIGRRKRDSAELSPRTKPETAHISRVVIEDEGRELEIVRHSFPYGTTSERGLFFIAYTRELAIPEQMLARMLGSAGDGLHDHLMDYTQAVSGANFFAPSRETLKALGRR